LQHLLPSAVTVFALDFSGSGLSDGEYVSLGYYEREDVEAAIAGLVAKYKLTGQYAFDYFREEASGRFFVIECNPRASSVLEGVSGTPGWGASFFGEDVRPATRYQRVGFWFHRNCWPFVAGRREGFWCPSDPLPALVAEIAWPLEVLRTKGALKGGELPRRPKGIPVEAGTPLSALFPSLFEAAGLNYHHLDVNIGKVIVPGPTVGRDYAVFEEIERNPRAAFVRGQVQQRGPRPAVLCDDAEIAQALAGLPGCEARVTRLAADPAEMMMARSAPGASAAESLILGTPGDTLRNLAQQGKAFDAVFLPQALLESLPPPLLAAGGCLVSLESLPQRAKAKLVAP